MTLNSIEIDKKLCLVRKMDRDKKNIAIIVLSIALVTSGILHIFLAIEPMNGFHPSYGEQLRVGTLKGPLDLDPVRSWDSASNDVIEQVCEGLYQYNLSDLNLGIVPRLASDYGTWDVTRTKFTVPLRRNVFFHDGTLFNAEAVKWNFERINWFINGTGTLNTLVGISQIHSLYEFLNGTTIFDPVTPVIKNSDYSVTINLRAPYAILESLLCYVTAYMLSPTSTNKTTYIETATGDIVGTGPFMYDHYIADTEVKFTQWDRYWRTGAYFEEVTFAIIGDSTTRNNAMLGHTIDYLSGAASSLFPTFDADYTITHRSGVHGLPYYYLGMNNKKINRTWRQAISYAINYTYIIEELQSGQVYRSNGPLAPNFPMSDPNIKAVTWNLANARQILVDAGITNLTANNDTTGPIADAWKAADFQSWEYWYNIGNAFREDLGVLLMNNLDQIGIEVLDPYGGFNPPIYPFEPIDYNSLELYWIGWGPDYLSPYNMIAPLFSNQSISNSAQYHNHTVEMWLEEVLSETNATKRADLYSKILYQIVEVDMPHAFVYYPYQHSVHSADLKGVPYNAMGSFYAYPMYRVPSEY